LNAVESYSTTAAGAHRVQRLVMLDTSRKANRHEVEMFMKEAKLTAVEIETFFFMNPLIFVFTFQVLHDINKNIKFSD